MANNNSFSHRKNAVSQQSDQIFKMNYKLLIVRTLQVILATLVTTWLILLYNYHVQLNPDSYGYLADSKNLLVPGYVTIRPILYPAYLRLLGSPGPVLSIITFLLNCAGLLYLVYISGGRRRLFSIPDTIVLICFFLLTAIWSYCGSILTESILFSVVLWVFVFITKIIFPKQIQHPLVTVLYSILVCILSITLKPWILAMVLLVSALLFLAALLLHSFRSHRRSSFILLAISAISFVVTLPYNRSKSAESANTVVLIANPGNEEVLKTRLKEDSSLSSSSAAFIQSLVSDIELINGRYKGNPWDASATNDLKLLNINDKKQVVSIKRAFHVMYFERGKDVLGLIFLAFQRYVSDLSLGLNCLDIAYGPQLPGVRSFAFPLIFISLILILVYICTRRDPVGKKKVGMKPVFQFLKNNRDLAIFTGIILFASVCFGLFLSLAGTDLQRIVLPSVLFELFALTYIILKTYGMKAPQK
jgi:hypothetical protein